MKTEVIIVGSGVSGLILSILLKRRNIDHVVLHRIEQRKTLELPETLPPSTLELLESLNLLELFSKSSSKTFGYHSLWNSPQLTTDNFFHHNPYKYGLKLNKKLLLSDLQDYTQDNIVPMRSVREIHHTDSEVFVTIDSDGKLQEIEGKLIIDATGRNRAVLKYLNVPSETFDNQIALSCHLPYFKHPQLIHPVLTESFEHGWGIVSSLNDHTSVMTLYTKKGSPLLPYIKEYRHWKTILAYTKFLKDFLAEDIAPKVFGGNANSSRAIFITGNNWMAVGDAAIAFDPLSSHGISNAIYCADAAAKAINSSNRVVAFGKYVDTLEQIFGTYLAHQRELHEPLQLV